MIYILRTNFLATECHINSVHKVQSEKLKSRYGGTGRPLSKVFTLIAISFSFPLFHSNLSFHPNSPSAPPGRLKRRWPHDLD